MPVREPGAGRRDWPKTGIPMLNPNLDVDRLAGRFREAGRLRIENVLEPEAAEALHECLDREVPWHLAFIGEQGPTTLPADALASMGRREREELRAAIHRRAAKGFQFEYNSYMMVTAYKEGRDPHLILHRLLEYLNAEPFLDFVRRVTGVARIRKADAQATRYAPGHFLSRHDDINPDQGREVAYVLNLTRGWRADWGGLLHFMDDDGSVIDTFMPGFNSLTLFRVPMFHCVSYVAPFAERPRYAVTGWLRSD